MKLNLVMALCRRTKVVKLTLVALLIGGLLYLLFPDEIRQFLEEFAPPKLEKAAERKSKEDAAKLKPHESIVKQKIKHSESETYLTPGNPGNFEPLRDEEGEGPGEHGIAHHTKPEQADRVDQSINEYGRPVNRKYYKTN